MKKKSYFADHSAPLKVRNRASEAAAAYTDIMFGNNATNADATRANAFKHAYWNAYMTITLGYDIAKGIADAHEAPFVNDPTLHVGIPNFEHCEMDFYNNEYGRQYGLRYADQINSEEQLAQLIYLYAMSDTAYYRKEVDGTIRDIDIARPDQYETIMSIIK